MIILVGAFTVDGVLDDVHGHMAHLFAGDFDFAATDLDDDTIRLSARLDGLPVSQEGLAHRLLEANLSGVETGSGAMAPDPIGSGQYALVDTVALGVLDADGFRLRVVDFMLHVDYWRSEGVANLQDMLRSDAAARRVPSDTMMVRA